MSIKAIVNLFDFKSRLTLFLLDSIRMRKLIRKIINWCMYQKYSKKVTIIGDGVEFFRTSHISQIKGASATNIKLGKMVRIYGHLCACADGTIEIGEYSQIGPGSQIRCVNKIIIGDLL